jgi:hypothetical protein
MSGTIANYKAPENLSLAIANVEKGVASQLAAATTIPQIKIFMAQAEAAKAFVKSLGKDFRDAEKRIEVMRFRGKEKLGKLIKVLPKATGTRGQLKGQDLLAGTDADPPGKVASLLDLGISKREADIARKVADLPAETKESITKGDMTLAAALAPTKAEKVAKEKVTEKKAKSVEADLRAQIEALKAENESLKMDLQEQKDAAFEALSVADAMQHLTDNTHVKRIKDLEVELRATRQSRDDYMRESASRLTQVKLEQGSVRRLEQLMRKNGLGELLRPRPVAVAA